MANFHSMPPRYLLLIGMYLFTFSLSRGQPLPFQFKSITVNDNLSHSDVICIVQDHIGYLWIGTNNGLNRFDGYRLETFKCELGQSNSLPGNRIKALQKDLFGNIWVSIENKGVFRFDPMKMDFAAIDIPYPTINVTAIEMGPGGEMWLRKDGLGLIRIKFGEDGAILAIVPYSASDITGRENTLPPRKIHASQDHLYVLTHQSALWEFDVHRERFCKVLEREQLPLREGESLHSLYHHGERWWLGSSQGRLFSFQNGQRMPLEYEVDIRKYFPDDSDREYSIRTILADRHQRLWLGTNAGLYLFQPMVPGQPPVQYKHVVGGESSLSSNLVNCLYEDRFGLLWVGTDVGGVDYTNLRKKAFHYIPLASSEPLSENNVVGAIYRDTFGYIWIGTRSGLYLYDPEEQRYLTNEQGQIDFLDLYTVFLYRDRTGAIWIGTKNDGLYRASWSDGKVRIMPWSDADGHRPQAMERTMRITEDRQGRLWVSTYRQGLFLISSDRRRFEQIQYDALAPNSLSSNKLTDVYCDPLDGSIWASTRDAGINHITWNSNDVRRIDHYRYDPADPASLSSDHCWQVQRSSTGELWIATLGGGINRVLEKENEQLQFRRYTTRDGLTDNDVESFEEDSEGHLWLGGVGLTKLDPTTGKCEQYYHEDGLQSNSFKIGASYKGEDGILYFGGINGVNYFHPQSIQADTILPVVLLTGLGINDQAIEIGVEVNGRVLLHQHLSETPGISLKANENHCSISFVALQFAAPEKNQYQYQLEGLNDHWISTQYPNLNARYYNIPPGDYIFKVRASNGDDVWNDGIAALSIHIARPWYKTMIAYLLYALLLSLVLLLFRQSTIRHSRLKNNLLLAEKDRELNRVKLRFFTQISHELRNPLSLIKIPVDELLKRRDIKRNTAEKLTIIQSSVNRLLGLVNQLLEFRKIESGQMKLRAATGNFVRFAKEVFLIFSQSASDKNINYEFVGDETARQLCFDRNKMEIVLMNLLHNAYKYTPENGTIQLKIDCKGADQQVAEYDSGRLVNNYLQLEVIDNGPGLAPEEAEKIFTPYYQVNDNTSDAEIAMAGTGIGLSLVKSITALHHGGVKVLSRPGYGACFRIRLPFGGAELYPPDQLIQDYRGSDDLGHYRPKKDDPAVNGSGYLDRIEQLDQKHTILIVEDNAPLREYLYNSLKPYFLVRTAVNGKEAFVRIQEDAPDLIVSDVMMPVMNGIQLCQQVKSNELLAHIPLILLTARTAAVYQKEGLEYGAEAYITKPFTITYLLTRIGAILQNREHLRAFYRKRLFLEPVRENRLSRDEQLVMEAIKTVEAHLDDDQFNVRELSRLLGQSKSTLYRKIKLVTGKTAVEFIRDIRLRHAARLLVEGDLTVKEVAYRVGFSDLRYFRKCFHNLYQINPSGFAKLPYAES